MTLITLQLRTINRSFFGQRKIGVVINKALFITFEGTDGVGKTTHIQLLSAWLKKKGRRVIVTREPGGGPFSEKLRRLLLDSKTLITPTTELFLYCAARSEHVDRLIRPALARRCVVLCDRFTDATFAYQGFGRGLNRDHINYLNNVATRSLKPNLTIWLDLKAGQGLAKAKKTKKGFVDRIEKEGTLFLNRVRRGYRFLNHKEPRRFIRIPVAATIDLTQKAIRKAVQEKLGL